jgi:asparagine synthetase B (glutamine-hydrolysing)
MAASRNPSIEAYTITFRPEDQRLEAMPDDAVYARKMAAHLGIRLHEIEISPDVVDMLPRVVDVLDEPIGDPAAINTVLMCQAARDVGVKVLLSGMGAEECAEATASPCLRSGGEVPDTAEDPSFPGRGARCGTTPRGRWRPRSSV